MSDKQRWAKMVNGRPQFAGDVMKIDGKWVANPKAAQLRSAGFKPYVDEVPSEPAMKGYHWEPNGWNDYHSISRVYVQVQDAPPPPRIFSKLKIVAALTKAGVWANVKQYIIDADLYDLYLAAQDFAEDNEFFTQGKIALQTALGWTDADVEAVLSQSEV